MSDTKDLKFYSQKSIGFATFLGGPLAAGYLIRENYNSLNDHESGKNAMIIGVLSTCLLFLGIFSIPETVLENIPNQIFPAVYTGIILLIVEKIHGDILKKHKSDGYEFHSGWKATGIGIISTTIILTFLFGYIFLSTDNEVYDQYQKEIAVFTENESESLKFYSNLHLKSTFELVQDLENVIIPKWEENLEIIEKTNAIENLPQELIQQNILLKEYAELRIETFKIFKKSIFENTAIYDLRLENLHVEIDLTLEKLNRI